MNVRSQASDIAEVFERWLGTDDSGKPHGLGFYDGPRSTKALAELDPKTATVEQINEAVRRPLLQMPKCEECDTPNWDLIEMGRNICERSTVYLCLGCLSRAHAMLSQAVQPPENKSEEGA